MSLKGKILYAFMIDCPYSFSSNVDRCHYPPPHVDTCNLQIVARAFIPDVLNTKLPPETLAAVAALEGEISMDLDLESAEDVEDPLLEESYGFRRLSAASAMLRLARLHDSRLAIDNFFKLALTIQVYASFWVRRREGGGNLACGMASTNFSTWS